MHPDILYMNRHRRTTPTYHNNNSNTTSITSSSIIHNIHNNTVPQQMPFLYQASLSKHTITMYNNAYMKLIRYIQHYNISITHNTDWDQVIQQYIHHIYIHNTQRNKSGKAEAQLAYSAFIHYHPQLSRRLVISLKSLRGFDKIKPSISHIAMQWELLLVMSMTATHHNRHDIGIALLLQFDCYLRISELCNININNIILPSSTLHIQSEHNKQFTHFRTGRILTIIIPTSKTGVNQQVSINNPHIEHILIQWINKRKQSNCTTLFSFTDTQYRNILKQLQSYTGTAHIPYTPHSIRHGGVTHDLYRYGLSALSEIKYRGRWQQDDSMKIYTQGLASSIKQPPLPQHIINMYQSYQHIYVHLLLISIRYRSCVNLRFT